MPYSDTYSDLYDPAFPQSQLDVRTELLLGGVWTDVSKKTYQRAGYAITRGHPDESSNVQPSVASMQVNNRGGQFSPRNPLGAYFGLLGRNTPLRLSVPNTLSYLRLENDTTSYASCPDRTALGITGDIDVRIDLQLTNYALCTLMTKWGSASNRSWALWLNASGYLVFEYANSNGSGFADYAATSTVTVPIGRVALRATMQANNGVGGTTTTFYTAPTISGPWTQLGSAVVKTNGTITLQTSTAPVSVGFGYGYIVTDPGHPTFTGPTGSFYSAQVYSGIGGTQVVGAAFSTQPAGTTAFNDGFGNIWTLSGTAEISDRNYRHHGEVPAWPQRWDNTGQDVYVPITPSGLLRRLTQGSPPVQSALYRGYQTLASSLAPVAYWPCEDGSNASSIASALPNGAPMQIQGSPTFAGNSGFACSQPIPVLNGSVWTGPVATAQGWTDNVIRFLAQIPSSGDTDGGVLVRFYTSGTVSRVDVVYNTALGGELTVTGYSGTSAVLFTLGPFTTSVGSLYRMSVALRTSGSNVEYEFQSLIVGASAAGGISGTLSSASIGAVTSVQCNPNGKLVGTAIGHVSVQRVWDTLYDMNAPLSANAGELAPARFARLCAEQGLACRIVGFPADSVAMGYQSPNTFVGWLQECEEADRGLMFEPRQVLALGYRTRASMLNQSPAVALDYSQAHLSPPIEPTDDDQFTVNDVTVTRSSGAVTGSSAREYLATGAQSIQAPPNGVGPYPTALSLNLGNDTQAAQEAGWILHVGTVDEPRYPTLTLDLARSELASLSSAVQAADIGDRLTVANTPAWLPPDGISQIIRGHSEFLNAFQHTITPVCVPESPYRVGVYDDPTYGRYDTDGSQTQGITSATAVTMLVATDNSGSPLWTTNAADFPFDIEVSIQGTAGERMTVTSITGTSSPQTFHVTRSVNGVSRSWPAGSDVRLFQPAVYSL